MGFRGNSNKFRPRPPKGPIRLQFGLVEKEADKTLEQSRAAVQTPYVFERQELVGTLTLQKMDLAKVKPLPKKQLDRILNNIAKIYEEGRYLSTNTIIDSAGDELLVAFSYNQLSIDRIKGLDRNERQWDPDNKYWRVFIACFDDLFDILGKGVKLTDKAYEALCNFINTSYYAAVAPSKLGKLIIRESWYEELDLMLGLEQVPEESKKKHLEKEAHSLALQEIQKQIALFSFKRKPYSHQIKGIEFLLENEACALLDEMGCGKSFQIASTISILLQNKKIEKCLIVAPKSLIKTWEEEVALATDLPFVTIEGSPQQRAKLFEKKAPIFIIHYEGVRIENERLGEWLKTANSMLVFDESQRVKNFAAQTTKSAILLRNNAQRCVIATGTPIANRPLDLFAQYYVMDKGLTFGKNFTAFKNTFCHLEIMEISQGRKKIKVEKFIGIRNGEELRKRILATSLRRLKSEVLDLPPIIYKDYRVELKNEQKSLYAKVRDNIRSEIEALSESEFSAEINNLVVRLLRLSQIASNPKLLQQHYEGPNAKFSEVEELLSDILSDDTKKVILWSHFVDNVEELTECYGEKWGAVAHTGNMSVEERQESISAFQNNPATRLFIATPQSAKEGLTLLPRDGKTKADTMIYLDLSFDSSSYIQSQARFHRIGQNAERCLVIHMLGESTVDEYIKKTIIDKLQTATKLLDNAKDSDINTYGSTSVVSSPEFKKQDILKVLS